VPIFPPGVEESSLGSSQTSLLLGVLALALSAAATAASAALASLGEHRAAALLAEGRAPAGLARVFARREAVRLSLLTLDTLGKLALGVLLALAIAAGDLHPAAAGAMALAAVVLLTLARALAVRNPEKSLLFVAPYGIAVDVALRPLVLPLAALARLARGGAGPVHGTTEELEYLIERGAREGALDERNRELLESVIEFSTVRVREIMVPRPGVVALDTSAPYEEVLRVVTESEHSRLPVFDGSIDDVVGILYARRLLKDLRPGASARASFRLKDHLAEPYFVPETMRISLLLAEFQRRRTHIAVVVDEFGGTAGIVTLEDVVEEIVGEIRDETDGEELRVRRLREGVLVADGGLSLRDVEGYLEDLLPTEERFEFPEEGDYETLAGFITAEMGRVPEPGAHVRSGPFLFTVRAADPKRVTRVEIARAPDPAPEDEAGPAAAMEEGSREGRGF
jgi:putative hemolysin